MPRHRKLTPTYTLHKQSGRGRLVWTDTAGVRHERLLTGAYGSNESLAAKARLELELVTSPTRSLVDSNDITVAELLSAYFSYASRYYIDAEGKPTSELKNMKVATRPLRELYAETTVLVRERLELGAAYTTVIASQRELSVNGMLVKMTL